jgi:hypothetical protein
MCHFPHFKHSIYNDVRVQHLAKKVNERLTITYL